MLITVKPFPDTVAMKTKSCRDFQIAKILVGKQNDAHSTNKPLRKIMLANQRTEFGFLLLA